MRSEMNGVVFQTSEKMMTSSEPLRVVSGGVESPRSLGDQQPKSDLEDDRDDGDLDGVEDVLPQRVRLQDVQVVAQTDEPVELREAQVGSESQNA
jgi:hypothetical protein